MPTISQTVSPLQFTEMRQTLQDLDADDSSTDGSQDVDTREDESLSFERILDTFLQEHLAGVKDTGHPRASEPRQARSEQSKSHGIQIEEKVKEAERLRLLVKYGILEADQEYQWSNEPAHPLLKEVFSREFGFWETIGSDLFSDELKLESWHDRLKTGTRPETNTWDAVEETASRLRLSPQHLRSLIDLYREEFSRSNMDMPTFHTVEYLAERCDWLKLGMTLCEDKILLTRSKLLDDASKDEIAAIKAVLSAYHTKYFTNTCCDPEFVDTTDIAKSASMDREVDRAWTRLDGLVTRLNRDVFLAYFVGKDLDEVDDLMGRVQVRFEKMGIDPMR